MSALNWHFNFHAFAIYVPISIPSNIIAKPRAKNLKQQNKSKINENKPVHTESNSKHKKQRKKMLCAVYFCPWYRTSSFCSCAFEFQANEAISFLERAVLSILRFLHRDIHTILYFRRRQTRVFFVFHIAVAVAVVTIWTVAHNTRNKNKIARFRLQFVTRSSTFRQVFSSSSHFAWVRVCTVCVLSIAWKCSQTHMLHFVQMAWNSINIYGAHGLVVSILIWVSPRLATSFNRKKR